MNTTKLTFSALILIALVSSGCIDNSVIIPPGGTTIYNNYTNTTNLTNSTIQINESQVTNLQTDLNSKLNTSGGLMSGDLTFTQDNPYIRFTSLSGLSRITSNVDFHFNPDGTHKFYVNYNNPAPVVLGGSCCGGTGGNVGIGMDDPPERLSVDGNISFTNKLKTGNNIGLTQNVSTGTNTLEFKNGILIGVT